MTFLKLRLYSSPGGGGEPGKAGDSPPNQTILAVKEKLDQPGVLDRVQGGVQGKVQGLHNRVQKAINLAK